MSNNIVNRNRNYVYFFCAVAIVSVLIMTGFILMNNNTFEEKIFLKTKISNGLGIETHPSILFKGFEIGRVTNFDFGEDLDVSVDFYVYKKYQKIMNSRSVIHPVRNPLTGVIIDFYVFSGNDGDLLLENGDSISSTEFERGRVLASNYRIKIKEPGVNEVVRRIDFLLKEIENQNIITNLGFVSGRLKDSVTMLEKEISNFQAEGNASEIKSELSKAALKVEQIVDNLNFILNEFGSRGRSISSTVNKAHNVLDNANDLLEGIQQNEYVKDKISPKSYDGVPGLKIND